MIGAGRLLSGLVLAGLVLAGLVLAGLVLAAAAGAAAARAETAAEARPTGASLRAEASARCIARHLPEGGQFFAASDGSFRVVSLGPRGKTAEWTVRPGKTGPVVSRQGGPAGIERTLKGACP